MKRLTPRALLLFGATCGCDVRYVEAVVQEMAALGATQEFFATNVTGMGFTAFVGVFGARRTNSIWVRRNWKSLPRISLQRAMPAMASAQCSFTTAFYHPVL